jgi:RHS repeat-associated protein
LVNALTNTIPGVSGGKATAAELTSAGISNTAATSFLSSQTYTATKPKAFINWIFLDEQFKYYGGGFAQVGASNVYTTHTFTNTPITKSGYLYVYVSNETPNIDVFFDNLQVTHTRGPLVSESAYSPWGLELKGISSSALNFGNAGSQKHKYNSIEYENSFDLNIGETLFRSHDPQLGRWWQIDPKIEGMYSWSPYVSNYDNPISYLDPRGDWPEWLKKAGQAVGGLAKGVVQGAWEGVKGIAHAVTHPLQTIKNVGFAITHPGQVWRGIKKEVNGIVNDFKNGDISSGFNKIGKVAGNVLVGYAVTRGVSLLNDIGKISLLSKLKNTVIAGEVVDWVSQYADELSALAKQATTKIDDLSNSVSTTVRGTNIHKEFQNLLETKYGKLVETEKSFLGEAEVAHGTKGSIRVDAIMYDASGNPVAIFDLKTGKAGLTEFRIDEIRAQLPPSMKDIPIKELRSSQ